MPRNNLTAPTSDPKQSAVHVELTLRVRTRRQRGQDGSVSPIADAVLRPRTPRITRLLALAVKFQDMVDRGEVRDYADISRLGYVTRARLTQIMNLLLLAPDIQEAILEKLNALHSGSTITERDLRSVSRIIDWAAQRRRLNEIGPMIFSAKVEPSG